VSDVEALVQLRLALWRERGEATSDTDVARLIDATHQYFQKALPTEELIAWIAEAEGRIVATSGLVLYHGHRRRATCPVGKPTS
jgi:hypothetical protein